MPERVCECGNKLSSMNRSLKCYRCKEEARKTKQATKRVNILEEMKEAGRVRLHSCISHLLDPAPLKCSCRKFVGFEEAKRYIEIGRCLDLKTRKPMFSGNAIVEASRLKKTARARFVDRADIERSYVSVDRGLKGKTVEELQAIIAADKHDRTLEEQLRIEIVGEMKSEMLRNMTREVPEDEWMALERIHLDVPMLPSSSADQRTSGGIGRTGSSHFEVPVEDTAEFVDVEEETNDIDVTNTEQLEDEEVEIEEAA
jgi:hypothetical protein